MSSCRGILVAGLTNRARTQMAEGFLRSFTNGRVFVTSGGVYHGGTVHPMAVRAMHDYGVDLAGQTPASLEGARRQIGTYDVYVSIDAPYTDRRAYRFHRTTEARAAELAGLAGAGADPVLAPAMPAHWQIGLDAADARQRWHLWSPRDPAVSRERSTLRFQDDLYEGEPLFMQVQANVMRVGMRVTERWELEEVGTPYAMERPCHQQQRINAACEQLCLRSLQLLQRLSDLYGEEMIVDRVALQAAADRSEAVRTSLEQKQGQKPNTTVIPAVPAAAATATAGREEAPDEAPKSIRTTMHTVRRCTH